MACSACAKKSRENRARMLAQQKQVAEMNQDAEGVDIQVQAGLLKKKRMAKSGYR